MNREILFRAKRVDNGEWIYGGLIVANGQINPGKAYILNGVSDFSYGDNGNRCRIGCFVEVDPSTVCQFTGLTDKNGKKIFEGDIARIHYFFENYNPGTLGAFEDEANIIGKLSITSVGVYFESANMTGYLCDYLEYPEEELEVIGNIFDNPELLEDKA